MFKKPSIYFYGLGGWLVLTNIGHTFFGMRSFLAQARDPSALLFQTFSDLAANQRGGVFGYDLFDLFMLGMVAITLLLVLGAVNAFWLARTKPTPVVAGFAGLNFGFWGVAVFSSLAFHPVDNMVLIAAIALILSGLGFWRTKSLA